MAVSNYRNYSGYRDPSAGKAITNTDRRQRRKRQRQLDKMDAIEDYERLCREFRQMAEAKGFSFYSTIWMKHHKTGIIFKRG